MYNRPILAALYIFFAVAGTPITGGAESLSPDTQAVFEQYADRVGKIQIVEIKSGAKTSIGSGFFAGAEGHIITNYHVVSKLIHESDRYRAEFLDKSGNVYSVGLVDVDVINDLAVIQVNVRPTQYFQIGPIQIAQGARLYSLGYPHDIGLSIVEGTHNGYFKHLSYNRIHFTGSINPGMSGGPAITSSGQVAGINVSTAGNQVSFLVPVESAVALLRSAVTADKTGPANLLDRIRTQILSHQVAAVPDDLMKSGDIVRLGNYELPGKLSSSFNCWADSIKSEKKTYEVITHECSIKDNIFISDTQRTGIIRFQHRLITSEKLNPFRFYKLLSDMFKEKYGSSSGSDEEVTNYRCTTRTLGHSGLTYEAVFCARSYRKLSGLYDIIFKAVILGSKDRGLETELILSGVSFEKGIRLSRDYLERIQWKE